MAEAGQETYSPGAVIRALDRMVAAGEADDPRGFEEATRVFVREFRREAFARGLGGWSPDDLLHAFQTQLIAHRDWDRTAAMQILLDVITVARHEQASLN